MIWIVLLILLLLIAGVASYKKNGEGYSAGRGLFTLSEYNLDDSRKDFTDYDPWEYRNMRK